MSASHRDITSQALALEPEERLRLAIELIDSVEGPDPRWEAAWAAELRKRTQGADQRSVRGGDWKDVRERLLRELADHEPSSGPDER